MACCLGFSTVPLCDVVMLDADDTDQPSRSSGSSRGSNSSGERAGGRRYVAVKERLDDAGWGGWNSAFGRENEGDGDDDDRDASSAAFNWTPQSTQTVDARPPPFPHDEPSFLEMSHHEGIEVDWGTSMGLEATFPERLSRDENDAATLANRSLDWSLLTSPNETSALFPNDTTFVLEEEPFLVYDMAFNTEMLTERPPPSPPSRPLPSPPDPFLQSPPSSPRTVLLLDPARHAVFDSDASETKPRSLAGTSWSPSPPSVVSAVTDASSYRRDRDLQVAVRSVSAAEGVDLAFVIDATGSMLKHIQNVKKSIRPVIAKCRRTHPGLRLRLAVVAYRDLNDAVPVEVMDFSSSVEKFEGFLGSLRAVGGADFPEDMATAVRCANRLSWAQTTRLVFIVSDAPCHGVEFHTFPDDYPFGTPNVSIVAELRRLLAGENGLGDRDAGIASASMFFGRISSSTDQMLHRWRTHYGIRVSVAAFADAAAITNAVTKSIRTAIFNSAEALLRAEPVGDGSLSLTKLPPGVRLKNFPVIPRAPTAEEWRKRPIVAVNVFRNQPIRAIEDLMKPLRVAMLKHRVEQSAPPRPSLLPFGPAPAPAPPSPPATTTCMQVRRAAVPFAEGEVRVAFHAHLARTVRDLRDYDASPPSVKATDSRFASMTTVLKTLKHHGPGLNGRQQYLLQMEMSTIAGFLAELYNRTRRKDLAPIHVLQVLVVEETSAQNEKSGNRRFCAESPLPSTPGSTAFTKYSNNTGYWNMERADESLLRFTEFTYEVTNGYLVVTDLQGSRGRNGHYYLTDPVLLCQDLNRFGNTNLGEQFMLKCLASTRSLLEERGRYLV
jgi:hypothetical protein